MCCGLWRSYSRVTETVSYLNSDLEELIEESDNLPLQRKLKELNMWQNWLEIVSHNAQKG
jgi:hypothetical protein